MLALAGACFFVALSHGPMDLIGEEWMELSLERKELIDEKLFEDLHNAIEFYANLTMKVKDDEFDELHGPEVRAIVLLEDGKKIIRPLEGFTPDAFEGADTL